MKVFKTGTTNSLENVRVLTNKNRNLKCNTAKKILLWKSKGHSQGENLGQTRLPWRSVNFLQWDEVRWGEDCSHETALLLCEPTHASSQLIAVEQWVPRYVFYFYTMRSVCSRNYRLGSASLGLIWADTTFNVREKRRTDEKMEVVSK